MSSRIFEDFEIVGFEGTVLVECEMVLPIARQASNNLYFKLTPGTLNESFTQESPTVSQAQFTREEIEAYVEEGRLTLLREPFPAFQEAMLAYFNSEFFEFTDKQIPDHFQTQHLSGDVWIICDIQERVESLLNSWANQIMAAATGLLEQYFVTGDQRLCSGAERITDLALCAATDKGLRARIYLRAGVAIILSDLPERIDNLYQLTVRHEFPDWSWEAFQTRVIRLSEILAIRVSLHRNISHAEEESFPKVIELTNVTSEIESFEERYIESAINAEEFRRGNPIDEDLIERVSMLITVSSPIRLDDRMIQALAGDPLFYFLGESLFSSKEDKNSKNIKAPLMQTHLYLRAAKEMMAQEIDPGRVARLAITKHVREAASV